MKKLLLVASIAGFIGNSLIASEHIEEKKSSKTKYILPALTIMTGTGLIYASKKLLTWGGFGLFTEASKNTKTEPIGTLLDLFIDTPIIIVGGTLLGVVGLGISAAGGYKMYSAIKED